MRIAFYERKNRPFSVGTYTNEIVSELSAQGIEFTPFSESDPLPCSTDLYWDPGTGRTGPTALFRKLSAPVIVTYHGAANLVLATQHCYGPRVLPTLRAAKSRLMTRHAWNSFSRKKLFMIAVSEYAKREATSCLRFDPEKITAIHHGADTSTFSPLSGCSPYNSDAFFLHVSQFQPKKNVPAIIQAYRRLNVDRKPRLVIVCPGFEPTSLPPDVELIGGGLSATEIAELYRRATAFLFPSLHETFGMPILEAMACGCPVITSDVTACPEIAGGAAMLVNPFSVTEIAEAMRHLLEDATLRETLRQRGLDRAKQFTWRKSAEQHLEVFKNVYQDSGQK